MVDGDVSYLEQIEIILDGDSRSKVNKAVLGNGRNTDDEPNVSAVDAIVLSRSRPLSKDDIEEDEGVKIVVYNPLDAIAVLRSGQVPQEICLEFDIDDGGNAMDDDVLRAVLYEFFRLFFKLYPNEKIQGLYISSVDNFTHVSSLLPHIVNQIKCLKLFMCGGFYAKVEPVTELLLQRAELEEVILRTRLGFETPQSYLGFQNVLLMHPNLTKMSFDIGNFHSLRVLHDQRVLIIMTAFARLPTITSLKLTHVPIDIDQREFFLACQNSSSLITLDMSMDAEISPHVLTIHAPLYTFTEQNWAASAHMIWHNTSIQHFSIQCLNRFPEGANGEERNLSFQLYADALVHNTRLRSLAVRAESFCFPFKRADLDAFLALFKRQNFTLERFDIRDSLRHFNHYNYDCPEWDLPRLERHLPNTRETQDRLEEMCFLLFLNSVQRNHQRNHLLEAETGNWTETTQNWFDVLLSAATSNDTKSPELALFVITQCLKRHPPLVLQALGIGTTQS
jgi:hypothetical protein